MATQTLSPKDQDAIVLTFFKGREFYDQMFNEDLKSRLAGMEIVSVGTLINGSSRNHWFVPYEMRWQDGSPKSGRLSVKLDPGTQRWYFDGGSFRPATRPEDESRRAFESADQGREEKILERHTSATPLLLPAEVLCNSSLASSYQFWGVRRGICSQSN